VVILKYLCHTQSLAEDCLGENAYTSDAGVDPEGAPAGNSQLSALLEAGSFLKRSVSDTPYEATSPDIHLAILLMPRIILTEGRSSAIVLHTNALASFMIPLCELLVILSFRFLLFDVFPLPGMLFL